jgi:hypothetical protein
VLPGTPSWKKAGNKQAHLSEQIVKVECYSGYRADERPIRIILGAQTLDVVEVEDRWYSPGATYFRVRVPSGERYVLRRVDAQDVWSLTAFRAPEKHTKTKVQ